MDHLFNKCRKGSYWLWLETATALGVRHLFHQLDVPDPEFADRSWTTTVLLVNSFASGRHLWQNRLRHGSTHRTTSTGAVRRMRTDIFRERDDPSWKRACLRNLQADFHPKTF